MGRIRRREALEDDCPRPRRADLGRTALVGFALSGLVIKAFEARVIVRKLPLQADVDRAWLEFDRWLTIGRMIGFSRQIRETLAEIARHGAAMGASMAIYNYIDVGDQQRDAGDALGAWRAYAASSDLAERLSNTAFVCRQSLGPGFCHGASWNAQEVDRRVSEEVERRLGHEFWLVRPAAVADRHLFDLGWRTVQLMDMMLPSDIDGATRCSEQTLRRLKDRFGGQSPFTLAFLADSFNQMAHHIRTLQRREASLPFDALAFRALTLISPILRGELLSILEEQLDVLGERLQGQRARHSARSMTNERYMIRLMPGMEAPGVFM